MRETLAPNRLNKKTITTGTFGTNNITLFYEQLKFQNYIAN